MTRREGGHERCELSLGQPDDQLVKPLRIVLIKPSKYSIDGAVERFKAGFMPNATLYHIASMTPEEYDGVPVSVVTVDEYVHTDLDYLDLLRKNPECITLVAMVGVQSHQFNRALDLAAVARDRGVEHCVIGGPHAMTCDTRTLQGRGVSFALAEAEITWRQIIRDAIAGELQHVYGSDQRWAEELDGPVIRPPSPGEIERYIMPMLGIYPVRGCPYRCNFCSVIKISGRRVRSPSIETTMRSLHRAKDAGISTIIFTSDNFNKFPQVTELLEAMIAEELELRFFCQCDTQIMRQPELAALLGRAGCFQMFVGVESFNRRALKGARKYHNHPERYGEIVRLCREAGIQAHFSNIIGFPEDTEEDILNQLETIIDLNPNVASFYILTPIPGTEQYDDFRKQGLIREQNLDRFDATYPTWAHPRLTGETLLNLLFKCYEDFYSASIRNNRLTREDRNFAYFNRYAASKRMHPMSGGISRVVVDTVGSYVGLRKNLFGVDTAPLPDSLKLSAQDEIRNRVVSWSRLRPLGEGAQEGPI